MGPLVPPLGILWLNGTADCPLLGFFTSGLVFGAPKGWPLGHMSPYLICVLWSPLLQLRAIRLPSQPLRTPSWPFSQWVLSLPGLISLEEDILHAMPFSCFEEGIDGFYNILGARWGITPSLQLTPTFRLE